MYIYIYTYISHLQLYTMLLYIKTHVLHTKWLNYKININKYSTSTQEN